MLTAAISIELKIIMEEFKVLITTSGIGSRLGELTKYTNKSLFYSAKLFYTTEVNKKKTLNKSFLLDFGYVESVGSVLL